MGTRGQPPLHAATVLDEAGAAAVRTRLVVELMLDAARDGHVTEGEWARIVREAEEAADSARLCADEARRHYTLSRMADNLLRGGITAHTEKLARSEGVPIPLYAAFDDDAA